MLRLSILLTVGVLALVGCADDGGPDDRDELSAAEAKGAVQNYYSSLDRFNYRKAWSYLGRNAKDALGLGFGGWSRSWKRNYEMNLTSVKATLQNETTATVAATLNRLDFDACNNEVWQTYSGELNVNLIEGIPLVQSERVSKVAGPEPVAAISDCQTIGPPPPTQPVAGGPSSGADDADGDGCHDSYAGDCVPPDVGDVDCPDVSGPIDVVGPDEYHLDGGESEPPDGIACELG